jgi:L-ribulokinase
LSIVAGIDFGTLSVRVSIFGADRGRIGSGVASYPLHRRREDPEFATQSHADHMSALITAVRLAIDSAKIDGRSIAAIALDTTGSSVVPVGKSLEPLDDYYMWCDHRAWREAQRITSVARRTELEAIRWCGGTYSSEWGFSKLLHWLRNNPAKRKDFVTALEHCDMVAAVLCGIVDPDQVPRSVCAMGHKWMWSKTWHGLPPDEFLFEVDPLLEGVRAKIARGCYSTSNEIAGRLCATWAQKLGLQPGIPVPVGALDAHWDAVGAGVKLGDVVNVIGTSTCVIAVSNSQTLVPGLCGIVPGSVHPEHTGIEAGLSATGDIFDAIARRAGTTVEALSEKAIGYKAGQTGLMRLTWDNGDRTVLVNPELGGATIGWNLLHETEDELFAAIEGTAFHTKIILERLEEFGTRLDRVINAGGIARKNKLLNQVYANVLQKPVLVPDGDVTGLGSAIFAFMAIGAFRTIESAQKALCVPYQTFEPEESTAAVYEELFGHFRQLYFGLGQQDSAPAALGGLLPALRRIAANQKES